MQFFSRICRWLAIAMGAISLCGLAIIVVSLAAQVFLRMFDIYLLYTDEIAQSTLVWSTFTGAAFIYRERGHIEIDFLTNLLSERLASVVATLVELGIITCMVLIAAHVLELRETMQRTVYGSLQLSKFILHLVPLFISAVCTACFALEAFFNNLKGALNPEAQKV